MSETGYMPEIGDLSGGFEDAFTNVDDPNEIEMPAGIPKPLYWRLLIYPFVPPRKTKGGIILSDDSHDAQRYLGFIGKLVLVGPKAFKSRRLRVLERAVRETKTAQDPNAEVGATEREITRFEDHFADDDAIPKPGDWVIFQRHAGLRIEYRGLKFIMCDDDAILALIDSPDGFKAYV